MEKMSDEQFEKLNNVASRNFDEKRIAKSLSEIIDKLPGPDQNELNEYIDKLMFMLNMSTEITRSAHTLDHLFALATMKVAKDRRLLGEIIKWSEDSGMLLPSRQYYSE